MLCCSSRIAFLDGFDRLFRGRTNIGDQVDLEFVSEVGIPDTVLHTFNLSKGAVQVREIAPAICQLISMLKEHVENQIIGLKLGRQNAVFKTVNNFQAPMHVDEDKILEREHTAPAKKYPISINDVSMRSILYANE